MKKHLIFLITFLFFIVGAQIAVAEDVILEKNIQSEICLHFFYKDDCAQCKDVENFMLEMENIHNVSVLKYKINSDLENIEIYERLKEMYSIKTAGYPIVFVGESYFVGEKSILGNLEDKIIFCKNEGCACPVEKIKGATPFLPQSKDIVPEKQDFVRLPVLGDVDFSEMSLFAITSIIAFIDGFNPCSLWLIMFLLGIVVHSGSRKKTITVGATFLLVTGVAYGLFMAGLLNVFYYIGRLSAIQTGVAIVALIFAIVNIKDYFWYKKGISFTISDKHKPTIFKRIRGLMKDGKSTVATVLGTSILALGVVLIELPCTAGFPMIWTNIIAQNQIQGATFLSLLSLYILIYLLIEILIILVAIKSMKIARFDEKHGRILKLMGGMIMLALAFIMFYNPKLMNNIYTAGIIFVSAIAGSFVLIFIHRYILPKLGINLGTEKIASEDDQLK